MACGGCVGWVCSICVCVCVCGESRPGAQVVGQSRSACVPCPGVRTERTGWQGVVYYTCVPNPRATRVCGIDFILFSSYFCVCRRCCFATLSGFHIVTAKFVCFLQPTKKIISQPISNSFALTRKHNKPNRVVNIYIIHEFCDQTSLATSKFKFKLERAHSTNRERTPTELCAIHIC